MTERPVTRSLTNIDGSRRNQNDEEAQQEQQSEDHQETNTRIEE